MSIININSNSYKDKVYACWVGKNIGLCGFIKFFRQAIAFFVYSISKIISIAKTHDHEKSRTHLPFPVKGL